MRRAGQRALETRRSERAQSTRKLPWIGRENPHRTPGKEKQASSVPTFGGSARPKKPVRRCFKLRPPWRAGFAGFASGCRLLSGSGVATWIAGSGGSTPTTIDPKTPGGCPAVDRIPTNRHAATGTCEIGRERHRGRRSRRQGPFARRPRNTTCPGFVLHGCRGPRGRAPRMGFPTAPDRRISTGGLRDGWVMTRSGQSSTAAAA